MAKKKKPVKKTKPRELIDTGRDKRYVRRNSKGEFKDVVDVGKSLAADKRQKSKKAAKSGYGDQGDKPKRVGPKLTRGEVELITVALNFANSVGYPPSAKLLKKLEAHRKGTK